MGEQPFSLKSQTVNISSFVGRMVSITTTQLCCCGVKAAIDNMKVSVAVFQYSKFEFHKFSHVEKYYPSYDFFFKYLKMQTTFLAHRPYDNEQQHIQLLCCASLPPLCPPRLFCFSLFSLGTMLFSFHAP